MTRRAWNWLFAVFIIAVIGVVAEFSLTAASGLALTAVAAVILFFSAERASRNEKVSQVLRWMIVPPAFGVAILVAMVASSLFGQYWGYAFLLILPFALTLVCGMAAPAHKYRTGTVVLVCNLLFLFSYVFDFGYSWTAKELLKTAVLFVIQVGSGLLALQVIKNLYPQERNPKPVALPTSAKISKLNAPLVIAILIAVTIVMLLVFTLDGGTTFNRVAPLVIGWLVVLAVVRLQKFYQRLSWYDWSIALLGTVYFLAVSFAYGVRPDGLFENLFPDSLTENVDGGYTAKLILRLDFPVAMSDTERESVLGELHKSFVSFHKLDSDLVEQLVTIKINVLPKDAKAPDWPQQAIPPRACIVTSITAPNLLAAYGALSRIQPQMQSFADSYVARHLPNGASAKIARTMPAENLSTLGEH